MKKMSGLSLLFSFFMTSFAMSQIPQTMSYQGVLTGADGNPVADSAVSFTFKLYDVATDGAVLWEEGQSLDVKGGIFNAILGSVNVLNLPFDKPYWLGITVGQEAEMTPRITLTASPYSLGATATVTEPKAGQGFVVRNADGDATHELSADGDVTHAGTGTFLGGIVVGDTIVVPVDTTGTAGTGAASLKKGTTNKIATNLPAIGSNSYGTQIGVFGSSPGIGVQGQTGSGIGVFGISVTRDGVRGKSTSGRGVVGFSETSDGVRGESTFGFGVSGVSETSAGVIGESKSTFGVGVFGLGNGTGVVGSTTSATNAGVVGIGELAGWFKGKLKVDDVPPAPNQERFVVWDADNVLKHRTLPASEGGFDGTLVGKPFYLINANGDTVFSVTTDGKSVHKGEETFLGGIKVPLRGPDGSITGHVVIDGNGLAVQSVDGKTLIDLTTLNGLRIFENDGRTLSSIINNRFSIHFAEETFVGGIKAPLTDADGNATGTAVIDKDGFAVKDKDGRTISGLGRFDLGTMQRIGVFGRAQNPGDLAGVFEGDVDVLGEVVASSLHVVNTAGDTLTSFNADGTSFHKGKETFAGGIAIINSDGSTAIDMKPNTDPTTGYALTINGNIRVNGILFAEVKQFKIDHPLDPENKYLLHTSIESPDMMNIYNGNVSLDNDGAAWVEMPDWFEALNEDFRYQLTCIGGFAQVYVAEEIQGNRFKIAGGAPGLKVSWQVTGIRHDDWAKEHRRPVEGYKRQH